MKVTHAQLQAYFDAPLPSVAEIADAFTFHCFEIDEVAGDMLDIKVLPNRAPDCSTEKGIAYELASILDLPLKDIPTLDYASAPIVAISLARINATLGSDFSAAEVEDVFRRLRFQVEKAGDAYRVQAPAPRKDIVIPEDVVEEVGRLLGYERIVPTELPAPIETPDQARYRGVERMKDQLVEEGFIEVSTQSFAKEGDVYLANPLDTTRPALRTSLAANLEDALARAKHTALRVLLPGQKTKLFEVGTVFPKDGEYLELHMTERVPAWGDAAGTTDNLSKAKLEEYGKDYAPKRYVLGAYAPFSVYPFVTRDIAFWAPAGTDGGRTTSTIQNAAGELLVKIDLFDTFEKNDRVSYAFRLVFESKERTLTDEEVNSIMEKVAAALTALGYEIR